MTVGRTARQQWHLEAGLFGSFIVAPLVQRLGVVQLVAVYLWVKRDQCRIAAWIQRRDEVSNRTHTTLAANVNSIVHAVLRAHKEAIRTDFSAAST